MKPAKKSHPWTPEEDAALTIAWADVTLSTAAIGAALQRTTASLYPRAAKLNLPSRPLGVPTANSSFWTDDRIKALRAEFDAGTGFTAIGRKLGCTKNMALGKCGRMGWIRAAQAWTPTQARTETHLRVAAKAHITSRKTSSVSAPKPRVVVCGNNTALAHVQRPALAFMPKASAWVALEGTTARPSEGYSYLLCNWPLHDESGEPTLRCCQPITRGAYCTGHAARGYQAPTQPGKRAVNELIRANRRYA